MGKPSGIAIVAVYPGSITSALPMRGGIGSELRSDHPENIIICDITSSMLIAIRDFENPYHFFDGYKTEIACWWASCKQRKNMLKSAKVVDK